jgi:hypothetical protein
VEGNANLEKDEVGIRGKRIHLGETHQTDVSSILSSSQSAKMSSVLGKVEGASLTIKDVENGENNGGLSETEKENASSGLVWSNDPPDSRFLPNFSAAVDCDVVRTVREEKEGKGKRESRTTGNDKEREREKVDLSAPIAATSVVTEASLLLLNIAATASADINGSDTTSNSNPNPNPNPNPNANSNGRDATSNSNPVVDISRNQNHWNEPSTPPYWTSDEVDISIPIPTMPTTMAGPGLINTSAPSSSIVHCPLPIDIQVDNIIMAATVAQFVPGNPNPYPNSKPKPNPNSNPNPCPNPNPNSYSNTYPYPYPPGMVVTFIRRVGSGTGIEVPAIGAGGIGVGIGGVKEKEKVVDQQGQRSSRRISSGTGMAARFGCVVKAPWYPNPISTITTPVTDATVSGTSVALSSSGSSGSSSYTALSASGSFMENAQELAVPMVTLYTGKSKEVRLPE